MGNILDYIFMESYSPRRTLLNIKYIIQKGNSSHDEETLKISKEILNMIPSKINFDIKNNIAISTKDYVDNKITISKLLCCEGLNKCHYVSISRDQHLLIAKVNLYTSTSMF
jgi:hypothetical protein